MYNEPLDNEIISTGTEETEQPNIYGYYSYDRQYRPIPPPAAKDTPKRGRGLFTGIIIGLFIGLLIAGFIAAPFLNFNRSEGSGFDLRFPGRPSSAPDMPTPTPYSGTPSTDDGIGGGNATLNIVPVVPAATPAPQPDAGGRIPLSNADIVTKGQPSTVCILVSNREYNTAGSGSGIVMTDDGYIITNYHVIAGVTDIEVVMHDKERYAARIVGSDQLSDLAVVKIEATGLIAAEFGDSNALEVGDPVVVIGNPLGLELQNTATAGMISAINRDIEIQSRVMTTLQTDASVNQGNSGGPMFNKYGQVVGVISSKVMGSFIGTAEGLGFAIPITPAKEVIDDLIKLGYVSGRPLIGIINYENITPSVSRFYNVPQGVRVTAINEKSDAFKQGLNVNDIIVEVNGKEIADGDELNAEKNKMAVGDRMTVKVYRDKQYIDITFELMEQGTLR